MRKLLTATITASALAVAAPAVAQYATQSNVNANGAVGLNNRIANLQMRLQAGVQQGTITTTEARPLRQQLRELTRLERQYSRNGLTQQERQDLQQRIRSLRQQLRVADNGRNDQYTNWQDDSYYGQGGPYEEVQDCPTSGGIGGIISGIFGGGNNGCGLRIGQQAPGNLYGVPNELRNQFRDGNGVYYRSDGRQVYQIDARTNTVVRAYAINR